ncbi:phage holin family protein [Sphingomonas sp. LaA6.9]|uniref:phage holin family protein n=1 Tax=Sphingomonas sp. LaA6.9 TaxID=2919914 RepID=UPI001F5015B5|nr:phage holin family protein [Sphingomonas sp. LaA6.9]MCJ8156187.1 phage holin family protein [Sphingomonas sp. LaA6.9]
MSDEVPPGESDPAIGQLFGQLIDDTKSFARAEISFYRAQALDRITFYGKNLALAAAGALLALFAIILLIVAAVAALAPITGLALAALIVAAALLALAVILFLVVSRGDGRRS